MIPESSESRNDNGSISSTIRNIPPKILISIISIGVLAIIAILTIAVLKGQKVSVWVLTIEPPSQDKNTVLASELVTLSPKYFDNKPNKEQLLDVIRKLISKAEETENLKQIIYYKIAMAEVMIPKYGTSINTKIRDKDMVEVYKNIQTALKAINFYDGDIDGDQEKTNKAVENFQANYNKEFRRDIIPKDELGYFGFYTCFAIGKWSRKVGSRE